MEDASRFQAHLESDGYLQVTAQFLPHLQLSLSLSLSLSLPPYFPQIPYLYTQDRQAAIPCYEEMGGESWTRLRWEQMQGGERRAGWGCEDGDRDGVAGEERG